MHKTTRRNFLKTTAVTAVTAPQIVKASVFGANERITIGSIGLGNRGTSNMREFASFSNVRVVAICDVIQNKLERAKNMLNEKYGDTSCATYNDFRELLARKDIDAVSIATPDHWHAITSIEACKQGKDVFCEKPLSLTISEGRAMVNTARKYGRVFSSGSQRILGDYGLLASYIRSGAIGDVKEAYVKVGGPSGPSHFEPQPVPDGLDWNMWLGPAPFTPFNYSLLNYRPWYDYSGGSMTDWGGHKFGAVLFAMDLQHTGPTEIIPPDGKDNKLLTFRFENGFKMYHDIEGEDITYIGTNGEANRRNINQKSLDKNMMRYKGSGGLKGDFLDCIRTRKRPFRGVEYGHRAATICHLGNIAYLLGRPLKWNPVKEEFIDDPLANKHLDRAKRGPWHL